MQWFALTWKRIDVRPFNSVALHSLLPLVGLILVVKTIWAWPSLRMFAIGGAVLLLSLGAVQLYRIHRLYQAVTPILQNDDIVLKKTLNEVGRTFFVGNAMFLLLCLILFQLHLWIAAAA